MTPLQRLGRADVKAIVSGPGEGVKPARIRVVGLPVRVLNCVTGEG